MKKIVLLILFLIIPLNVNAYSSSATSTILMDTDNNRILYASNIHEVRSIASISKIMTAILAIENSDLEQEVVIGDEINEAYGSGIYIKKGEVLTVKDLVYGLMLRSGNDAALAIAHHVGGSVDDFVKLMNEKAKELGMKNTTFNNPSGLDEDKGNYSTAYDMAILTSYAMKNETYKEITKTKKYKLKTNLNYYEWINKNKLLSSYKYATGGKTGFTKIAKRTLVTTASKDNINLVAVTLNDGNDFEDHKNLFEETFNAYQNYSILKKGNINITDEKYYKKHILYIKNDFNYLLSNNEKNNIILKFELEKKYDYKDGDKIGNVIVKLGDTRIHKEDIYIKLNKTKISIWELIARWFK
ncbi:MAG: D-alanyl-D-alanine carboxypeptidase [Firmicutes bacterium]|nr:D-alanyl-D-alanine carboxypeptidase [Bacillota bacterium]